MGTYLSAAAATVMIAVTFAASLRAESSPSRREQVQPGSISARVTEAGNGSAPLEFVTVALRDSSDNVVAAAITDSSGVFRIDIPRNAAADGLSVEFSLVGYQDRTLPLSDVAAMESVGLEVDARQLESAKIVDKRSLLEHKFDRIVMNVSELAVAKTGNATDVLRAAPGVTIDKDGNLQLNGQSVSVWLDGKPSNMSGRELQAYLNGSSGMTIEKIEIISNPSSKYDAEGSGGIIDIKTKRGFMRGFNGSVTGQGNIGWKPRANGTGNLSARLGYKGRKTNTSLSYNPYGVMYIHDNLEEKRYGTDYGQFRSSDSKSESYWMGHNVSLMSDWNVTDKDILGGIVRVGIPRDGVRDTARSVTSDYTHYTDENPYSELTGDSKEGTRGGRVSVNLNYTHKFDESRNQELTLNADYNRSSSNSFDWQRNRFTELSESARQDMAAGTASFADNGFNDSTFRTANIWSFKADYSQAFRDQKGRLEAGVKAAVSITDNSYRHYEWNPEADKLPDAATSRNDFRYTEQIYAAYVNVSRMFSDKWNAQIGLRGEYTVPKGNWKTDNKVTGKPYFDVFPSVFCTYMPSPKAILTVNYSYRLSRPRFWQLNPFKAWINPYSYSVGDPDLLPSYSHNVSLSGVFFSHLTLTAGYSHNRNYSDQQMPIAKEGGVTEYRYLNSGKQQNVYVSLALSEQKITGWWTVTANLNYYHQRFEAYKNVAQRTFGQDEYKSSTNAFMGYGSTTFYLPKDFKITFDGWGMTPQQAGYFKVNAMGEFNASVTKSFLDGRASLTLGMNDILNSMATDLKVMVGDVPAIRMKVFHYGRTISLGFTYTFGQMNGSRRNVGKSEEGDRL